MTRGRLPDSRLVLIFSNICNSFRNYYTSNFSVFVGHIRWQSDRSEYSLHPEHTTKMPSCQFSRVKEENSNGYAEENACLVHCSCIHFSQNFVYMRMVFLEKCLFLADKLLILHISSCNLHA